LLQTKARAHLFGPHAQAIRRAWSYCRVFKTRLRIFKAARIVFIPEGGNMGAIDM
jgi:hypothetical protein